ncbi:MAG: SDR family oxidoreductase [Rhizobiaceae bacterium]|nr:SDR family oxidoreductase [Rhizobiaceae bacterium]
MTRFQDKIAIVSGGADGMGAACVRRLAAEGATVYALDVKFDTACELADELSAAGARVTALQADVLDEAQFRSALRAAVRAESRVDVLINVAGGSAAGMIADIDLGVWDRLYELNVRSTLIACQEAIPAMRLRGSGSIVNMASISGLRGDPGWAAYNSAKAAIISLTQSLAWEEGLNGIRVNAICPGPVASQRMLATLPPEAFAKYDEACALGRMGRAEELAEAILFLASDQASFVTGASLVADGGLTASTAQPTDFGEVRRAELARRRGQAVG